MSRNSEPRPKHGWIYMINPYRVFLTCRNGHKHFHDLGEPDEINCPTIGCHETINPSKIFRGVHPYIIWTSNEFLDDLNKYPVFTAIPLTSQKDTPKAYELLPTTYDIKNTSQNGLTYKSYALIHQITTIDGNCFKDSNGNWLKKKGTLSAKDKRRIEERLIYLLGISETPSDDWFRDNTSPELVKKVFDFLPESQKQETLDNLIDDFS
jgi:mRNA interferase MazF